MTISKARQKQIAKRAIERFEERENLNITISITYPIKKEEINPKPELDDRFQVEYKINQTSSESPQDKKNIELEGVMFATKDTEIIYAQLGTIAKHAEEQPVQYILHELPANKVKGYVTVKC